jgi:hypothetical protein
MTMVSNDDAMKAHIILVRVGSLFFSLRRHLFCLTKSIMPPRRRTQKRQKVASGSDTDKSDSAERQSRRPSKKQNTAQMTTAITGKYQLLTFSFTFISEASVYANIHKVEMATMRNDTSMAMTAMAMSGTLRIVWRKKTRMK